MKNQSGRTAEFVGSDPRLVRSYELTAGDPHPASCIEPGAKGAKDVKEARSTPTASGARQDPTREVTKVAEATQSTEATEPGGEGGSDSSGPPVALVVVAHTPLASALRDIAQHVFGHDAPITAIDVLPGACAEDSSEAMLNQIKALDQGAGVLIMTDLPGASPCNVCASAAAMAREQGIACEVITGVNAAMILRAISYREQDIVSLAQHVIEGASKAVMKLDQGLG